jgi:hypothetical protein
LTLQRLKEPTGYNPAAAATLASTGRIDPIVAFALGLDVDARFQDISLPPAVIVDYMYGVAAYNRWSSRRDVDDVMESYRAKHYAHIPVPPLPSPPSDDDDDDDAPFDLNFISGGSVDSHDRDHPPPTSLRQRHYMSTRRGDVMGKAMNDLNLALMFLQGITPQEAANRRERQMVEEELKAREAGQIKVTEWMRTSPLF